MLRLLHESRDKNLPYLSKDKKDIKSLHCSFHKIFKLTYPVLTRKQWGAHSTSWKSQINDENRNRINL